MNIELLVADIVSRIPEMARDSSANNEELLKRIIREHVNRPTYSHFFADSTATTSRNYPIGQE